MKKVFQLTNKYIVLGTPLILFSLFTSIYIAVSANGKIMNVLFAFILLILMTAAFIAGWFNMVKGAVDDKYDEQPNMLIKDFTSGVGEYFTSSLSSMVIMFIIGTILLYFSYLAGMHYIGNPGITAESLTKALETTVALKAFLTSLTTEQLLKLNQWNILLLATMMLSYFLLLFYIPAIFFKNKNPFIALWYSLKDLFSKKFFITLAIYILIFITNFIITLLTTMFVNNSIVNFILTLANFYFVTVVSVGICKYYNDNFVKNLLGQNIDKII